MNETKTGYITTTIQGYKKDTWIGSKYIKFVACHPNCLLYKEGICSQQWHDWIKAQRNENILVPGKHCPNFNINRQTKAEIKDEYVVVSIPLNYMEKVL